VPGRAKPCAASEAQSGGPGTGCRARPEARRHVKGHLQSDRFGDGWCLPTRPRHSQRTLPSGAAAPSGNMAPVVIRAVSSRLSVVFPPAAMSAIIDAIKARERRRQELRELLTREEMPRLDLRHLRSEAQRLLNEWRRLLRKHVEQGQQVLQKLIEGRLTFEPREDATGRYYAFRGVGTVTKLLAGLVPQNVASPDGIRKYV
jgi:hypothetical protein